MSRQTLSRLSIALFVLVILGSLFSLMTGTQKGQQAQGPDGAKRSGQTALRDISFATDWKAQAEHGGFYQALAKGFYADVGLNVTLLQGGPGINVPQLLVTDTIDFGIGSNSFIPINMVEAGAPGKAVMAVFQKDPQVLITHPRADIKSIADMKGHPIMISDSAITSFWVWLRAEFDFEDTQIRKYNYNLAPFIVDPNAIQQGYLSAEPFLIKKEGGFDPTVFLMSDAGYPSYATMVLARNEMILSEPEVVQAFVDASIRGWYDYLYGDPTPGNALIKRDNPEVDDDTISQAIAKMKSYRLADSGDALDHGIGAMNHAQWSRFYTVMAGEGVWEHDVEFTKAYTLQFVNKKTGMALKQELLEK